MRDCRFMETLLYYTICIVNSQGTWTFGIFWADVALASVRFSIKEVTCWIWSSSATWATSWSAISSACEGENCIDYSLWSGICFVFQAASENILPPWIRKSVLIVSPWLWRISWTWTSSCGSVVLALQNSLHACSSVLSFKRCPRPPTLAKHLALPKFCEYHFPYDIFVLDEFIFY
jgi:hypothetical protein